MGIASIASLILVAACTNAMDLGGDGTTHAADTKAPSASGSDSGTAAPSSADGGACYPGIFSSDNGAAIEGVELASCGLFTYDNSPCNCPLSCTEGTCLARCTTDSDCSLGFTVCSNGLCQPNGCGGGSTGVGKNNGPDLTYDIDTGTGNGTTSFVCNVQNGVPGTCPGSVRQGAGRTAHLRAR